MTVYTSTTSALNFFDTPNLVSVFNSRKLRIMWVTPLCELKINLETLKWPQWSLTNIRVVNFQLLVFTSVDEYDSVMILIHTNHPNG